MTFRDDLKEKMLFFDGGMGTMLQAAGLPAGKQPEDWVMEEPEHIRQIHDAYLSAGCHILTSCTFGANPVKYHGDQYTTAQIVPRAMEIARRAVAEHSSDPTYVALDVGPTGTLLEPLGTLSFEDAVASFQEVIRAGADQADLILIETISDLYELKAAVIAAKECTDLPIIASVILDERGKLLTGGDPAALVCLLEGLKVDALGVNCGFGPRQMLPFVQDIRQLTDLPLLIMPNAGLPRSEGGQTVYDLDPDAFAQAMEPFAGLQPRLLGGCCGTTPDHLKAMIGRLSETASPAKADGDEAASLSSARPARISSYTHAIALGDPATIIGEKINPTGNKALADALRAGDMEYVARLAVRQKEAGAQVLDVNVGLPDVDEPTLLPQVVQAVQSVVDLPLVLDTSNPEAMEKAVRIYNGKPLINSVNAKDASLDAILPIAAKYGAAVIGLTLGEDGIPATPEGRLAVARFLIEEAATYDIPRQDVVIDPLAMTISADSAAAKTTLQSVGAISDLLGVCTVLGVSNISFGLPVRETINHSFLAMALERGLSAAIMDPFSKSMMDTMRAGRALLAQDENCQEYIANVQPDPRPGTISLEEVTTDSPAGPFAGLTGAIEGGLKESAAREASALLSTHEPLTLVNEGVVPALNRVGDLFESGDLFLPQLLMSAEAATTAFEEIKKAIPEGDGQTKGAMVLATVEGDIHDIGKNIVKVLLQSYGFDVVDLGRDVPVETVVRAAVDRDIHLIGLSALMTTTVPSMKKTIRRLKEELPDCIVCVGGAVLTESYAADIGADHYCRDAMVTVRRAEEFYS